jgi:asparagine synthase (glutamine-hydrolysing)
LSFACADAQEWIGEIASPQRLEETGAFNPTAAAALIAKCTARAAAGQFSNADNMAVVGVLSTQLVDHHFVRSRPSAAVPRAIRTVVDRTAEPLAAV